jgi:hypothetical protein
MIVAGFGVLPGYVAQDFFARCATAHPPLWQSRSDDTPVRGKDNLAASSQFRPVDAAECRKF